MKRDLEAEEGGKLGGREGRPGKKVVSETAQRDTRKGPVTAREESGKG